MALIFSFRAAIEEARAIKALARPFLDPETVYLLDNLQSTFEQVRRERSGRLFTVEIPQDKPLRTKASAGEYEPAGRKGGHKVVGELTGHWEIEPLGRADGASIVTRQFAVKGNASITTRIREMSAAPAELSAWNMEMGTSGSPGCHFHAHVPLKATSGAGAVTALPVPRLPNLLFTFGDCIEFLLAEIFQERWMVHAIARTPESTTWRRLQQDRLARVLDWQRERITGTTGAPWTALKMSKPQDKLFVE